jgi:hypothetical protein
MRLFLWRVREIKEDGGERKCPSACWDLIKLKVVKAPLFLSTVTKYFIFDFHPCSELRPNRVYTMLLYMTGVSISNHKSRLYVSHRLHEEIYTLKVAITCRSLPCSRGVLMTHGLSTPKLWHHRLKWVRTSDFVTCVCRRGSCVQLTHNPWTLSPENRSLSSWLLISRSGSLNNGGGGGGGGGSGGEVDVANNDSPT